jgi:phosphoglycerate dehydrogenase-like enzyme
MPKCVYTAKNVGDGPHLAIFRDAGFDFEHIYDTPDVFVEDNLIAVLKDASAVIAGSEPYTPRVIESLPKLRVIARAGVGFDAVNLAACDKAGIAVTTTPGVNHHCVAEHTLALLLGVARGFPSLDQKVRAGTWSRKPLPRVMDRTLGIVGLGRIGQAVATRAVGIGMKVVALEPFPNAEFVAKWGIEIVDLDTLLARSDYVTLHCPATKEAIHMMNDANFAKMKDGSVLINTARGALVDEKALVRALDSGKIRAAGLDVFEVEPLPTTSPLLKYDNILFAGHVGGMDIESIRDTNKMAAETIVGLSKGIWPTGCVQNLKGREATWKW